MRPKPKYRDYGRNGSAAGTHARRARSAAQDHQQSQPSQTNVFGRSFQCGRFSGLVKLPLIRRLSFGAQWLHTTVCAHRAPKLKPPSERQFDKPRQRGYAARGVFKLGYGKPKILHETRVARFEIVKKKGTSPPLAFLQAEIANPLPISPRFRVRATVRRWLWGKTAMACVRRTLGFFGG